MGRHETGYCTTGFRSGEWTEWTVPQSFLPAGDVKAYRALDLGKDCADQKNTIVAGIEENSGIGIQTFDEEERDNQ